MKKSILYMKAPGQEEYSKFCCNSCHKSELHIHDAMYFKSNEVLACAHCENTEQLDKIIKDGKPFGFRFAKLTWEELEC